MDSQGDSKTQIRSAFKRIRTKTKQYKRLSERTFRKSKRKHLSLRARRCLSEYTVCVFPTDAWQEGS